jgi:hypothetical protein
VRLSCCEDPYHSTEEDQDMITATLLNNMEPEHALNALRADLPDDLIWLVDWVERVTAQ